MVLSKELFYVTDIPSITANNLERYLDGDPLFTEYFNTFMTMEIFLNRIQFKQELDCFEVLNNEMEAKTENAADCEDEENGEDHRCELDPNTIYSNVQKNSYSTIPLINIRKEVELKNEVKTESPEVETLNKEVGLGWIKATRLSSFLKSLPYAEYRIAKLLSQVQIIELDDPKHELIMGFRELVEPIEKLEEGYEVVKKTSLEYLLEILHISKGRIKLAELKDWYRMQKTVADDFSTDSMLFISREYFSESTVGRISDTGDKEESQEAQQFPSKTEYDPTLLSITNVPFKTVVFKDVTPIIYLEPFENLVVSPYIEETESNYLDAIQNLDELASLLTIATFKGAFAALGSTSKERLISDLASEPCLAKLNNFHFDITLDKLNDKKKFSFMEKDAERQDEAAAKHEFQEDTTSPNNLEEDITPSNKLEEDVIPRDKPEEDVTPSNNVEENLTPSNNVEDITPSNNDEYVAPSDNVEVMTPSNNVEDITPSNNVEENITPSNNVEDITPSNNTEYITPSNNTEYITPSNNTEYITPSNNVEECITPSNNVGDITPPKPNEDVTPPNNAEYVIPDNGEEDINASYNREQVTRMPNLHKRHASKRDSLLFYEIRSPNDLIEDESLENNVEEKVGIDLQNTEPLAFYTMETNQDFINFYNFLKGTPGEKYWHLWINMDRVKLMKTDFQKQTLFLKIHEGFAKVSKNSKFQRNIKEKFKSLNLNDCSEEKIKEIQALLLQPLILYWLPHYLLINLSKIELSKYPSYASLINNKRKLESSINYDDGSDWREVSQTPCIYKVVTEEKKKPEPKPEPPVVLPLPPQLKRIGMRRTHLISSLKNCGKYGNNVLNNLDKIKKGTNGEKDEAKIKVGQPKPKTKRVNLELPSPKVCGYKTRDLPMLPETTPVVVETIGESQAGWAQRQHPMPKLVKVDRILGEKELSFDPWLDKKGGPIENTKIKLLNSLLEALRKENDCGNYFENFLNKCQHKHALNCLYLWHNIEKFLKLFYTQPVNMFVICRYAKFIYSQFIAQGSLFNVHARPTVMSAIWQNLDAPVGDMFDSVVEHILIILAKFWHKLLLEENWIYKKVTSMVTWHITKGTESPDY